MVGHSGWWPLDSSKWGNTPGEFLHTNPAPAVVGPPGSSGGDVDPPSSWEGCPGRCGLNTATLSLPPFYFNLRASFHHSVFCPVNNAHISSNLPPPHSRPSLPIHFPRPCYLNIHYGIRQTMCISSIISIVLCCKSHGVSCVFSKLHKRTSPCCPCARCLPCAPGPPSCPCGQLMPGVLMSQRL